MEASNSFLALSVMGNAFETKGMKSKSHGFSLLASLPALFWASILASSPPLFSAVPIHVSSGAFVIKPDFSHLAWCARFMPQWKKCFGVSIVTQNSSSVVVGQCDIHYSPQLLCSSIFRFTFVKNGISAWFSASLNEHTKERLRELTCIFLKM